VKNTNNIKVLPYPVYFWTVFSVAFAGLLDAVYLTISHYRVYTDVGYKSICAVSKAINCDTVSQSPFSIFLNVPVPVWGLLGYGAFLVMLLAARRRQPRQSRIWPTLFLMAMSFAAASIILAWISIVHIHSYCIMCLASHAVSFLLMFLTWLVYRRFATTSMLGGIADDLRWFRQRRKSCAVVLSAGLLGILLLISFFPTYWNLSNIPSEIELPTGTTPEGHPWIGAVNPELVITEFTDYQCFQCKKMHFYLRELMARYPDKLRLIHRHFPMDHAINPLVTEPYHIGSRKMALLAMHAADKDNFWKINDMLYGIQATDGNFNIRKMAKAGGFDVRKFAAAVRNPYYRQQLKRDIHQAIQLGIDATPGYLINGKVYVGHIPVDILISIQ
jgi:uncharacterized membrane protein